MISMMIKLNGESEPKIIFPAQLRQGKIFSSMVQASNPGSHWKMLKILPKRMSQQNANAMKDQHLASNCNVYNSSKLIPSNFRPGTSS